MRRGGMVRPRKKAALLRWAQATRRQLYGRAASSLQPSADALRDAIGQRHHRENGIYRRTADEDSRVGDVDVVEIVAAAVDIDDAVLRAAGHARGAEDVVRRRDGIGGFEAASAEYLGFVLCAQALGNAVQTR